MRHQRSAIMTKPIPAKTSGRAARPVISTPPSRPDTAHGRSRGGTVEEPESSIENVPDVPAGESLHERLDPETRYRMISERAYHLYVGRGYAEGSDIDDWLEAEAQVDSMHG